MEIKVHFTATKVGQYELACAELCGQNHFKMRGFMLVLPDNEFEPLKALPQAQFQEQVKSLLAKYPIIID
jgi:heme/copper-type cytochrome/quinol oxidase subunit 2